MLSISLNFLYPESKIFPVLSKDDGLVKSRHTGENRCPVFCKMLQSLDSGFHRNDDFWAFSTFDESIKDVWRQRNRLPDESKRRGGNV